MTKERKEELVRKLVAYAAEQGNTLIDTPRKVLQEITDDINDHIAPFNKILLPFYITAMEHITQSLRAHFPKEAELADDLKSTFTCYGVMFPKRKNK